MRLLCPVLITLLFAVAAVASEIREFDLKTLEKLGNELSRVSQRSDCGATDSLRKRALETATVAVSAKLNTAYDPTYKFVVLNDPDGSGFLVYGLATFTKKDAIYLGGHARVTVSADGSKVERIDELSHGIIENKASPDSKPVGLGTAQAVNAKYPVETFIYSGNLYHIPISVATLDGTVWLVANGEIRKMDPNLVKQVEAESKENAKK